MRDFVFSHNSIIFAFDNHSKPSMKLFRYGLFTIAAIHLITSCTSFEEGSYISFKSAEARIEGTWELNKVMINDLCNDSIKNEEASNYLVFAGDGSFQIETRRNGNLAYTRSGCWNYNSESQYLNYTIEGDTLVSHYYIKRLTSKEMWLVLEKNDLLRNQSSIEKRFIKQ